MIQITHRMSSCQFPLSTAIRTNQVYLSSRYFSKRFQKSFKLQPIIIEQEKKVFFQKAMSASLLALKILYFAGISKTPLKVSYNQSPISIIRRSSQRVHESMQVYLYLNTNDVVYKSIRVGVF